MKKFKYFIPACLMMILIFFFSHQTGNESSDLSQGILAWVLTVTKLPISELFIRKMAHASEYALLALLFTYGFYHLEYPLVKTIIISFVCTFLYACTDEFHQLFVEGRSGQVIDVMIDSSGAIIALAIFYIILKKRTAKHS